MYNVFKRIDQSSTIIEKNVVNYTHNLTTASSGVSSVQTVTDSINTKYWDSLNVLFYCSGSPKYSGEKKFSAPFYNFTNNSKQLNLNKFHGYASSSIITIPSTYYGEKIKEGSFQLVDKSFIDNAGNNPIIKDDKFGNLYSTNAHHSQSTTHASSSDNYIGNIFYERGIAVITETGSWSGSVNYSDITNGTNFTLQFDSHNTIITHEYSVTLNPNEFNHSMNYTLKAPPGNPTYEEFTGSLAGTEFLAQEFTSSRFTPYITEINLYRPNEIEPIIKARFPKPIKKSKVLSTTFKIKLDL